MRIACGYCPYISRAIEPSAAIEAMRDHFRCVHQERSDIVHLRKGKRLPIEATSPKEGKA